MSEHGTTSKYVPESRHISASTAGWLVELAGDALDAPMFLSISVSKAQFGWTPRRDQALMLARETDANAFVKYANARTRKGTMAIVRRVELDRERADVERENDRLRRRIGDLEFILAALRKIRAADIERAMEESQSKDEQVP